MSVVVLDPLRVVRHVARCRVDDLIVTHDTLYTLEELHSIGTPSWDRGLHAHDHELFEDLERRGLAQQQTRGLWEAGPNLADWYGRNFTDASRALAESRSRAYFNPEHTP